MTAHDTRLVTGRGRKSKRTPVNLTYDMASHAYQRTDNYLFAQLFPYIGNKRKLLPLIAKAVARTGVTSGTFADLLAGTGVVGRMAKMMGYRVVSNDWEPYAHVFNQCFIGLNAAPLENSVFAELNCLEPVEGFVTRNYCPSNDANPDALRERMFYTRENGMRIDAIRLRIGEWMESGQITGAQYHYLLAPLISAASFVSNTSGVFKAYHNGWGGATETAHYRILSRLRMAPPPLHDNGLDNIVVKCDALNLARHWREIIGGDCTIAYIDPPYNQHPYGSNYHMLNTIALYDSPDVPAIEDGKSAIRTDWRTLRRSSFNHWRMALPAMESLVDSMPSRWVLISYSTDGNIPVTALLDSMAQRGAIEVEPVSYKRYRVSTQRMSPRSHNVEFVLILDKQAPMRMYDSMSCLDAIRAARRPDSNPAEADDDLDAREDV